MKRIVIWALALVMGTLYAQAQGAGLSQGEAVKTAQLGIRYDAPSIEAITFTTSDGKNYKYGE